MGGAVVTSSFLFQKEGNQGSEWLSILLQGSASMNDEVIAQVQVFDSKVQVFLMSVSCAKYVV